ncbi:MAG: exosome complex exonuclease Rrp41 [Candidatus Woesearchaeota archaeon]
MAKTLTRHDGRKWNETRKITAEAGIIPKADGSARFTIGDSTAYAAVYGPQELHPRFMQDPKTGILRCHYNMLPYSGPGGRGRPGPNRRSQEISMVTENALSPVVDLTDFPNTVVDVHIEFTETDAGSRCAGICAAAIALADAGIKMKDLVSAVAVGHLDGEIVIDLDGEEEHFDGEVADIPIAVIPSTGEITLLQMDGLTDQKLIVEAIKKGRDEIEAIAKVQREAVKNKFVNKITGIKETKELLKKRFGDTLKESTSSEEEEEQ